MILNPLDKGGEPRPLEGIDLVRLARLRSAVLDGVGQHFAAAGVEHVRPPLVVDLTGACENASTLVRIEAQPDARARYLSQTGQFQLEAALAHLPACWCHTISFRDEPADTRHLPEFELIEEEFSAATGRAHVAPSIPDAFDALLARIERTIKAAASRALANLSDGFQSEPEHLTAALTGPFPRVTYDAALELCNVARRRDALKTLKWGSDLRPEDEVQILRQHAPLPVFVTHYPAEIKFFNMKLDPASGERVLSADLLLPVAGESVGAAIREDDVDLLVDRLRSSSMFRELAAANGATLADFEPYLTLVRRNKTGLHAGYGIGLERVLQFVTQARDIRSVSMAQRLR